MKKVLLIGLMIFGGFIFANTTTTSTPDYAVNSHGTEGGGGIFLGNGAGNFALGGQTGHGIDGRESGGLISGGNGAGNFADGDARGHGFFGNGAGNFADGSERGHGFFGKTGGNG